MAWGRVDDDLAFHPKIIKAGNAAMGLWVRALSWCVHHVTDGRLPHEIVAMLGADQADADRLCAVGLWRETIDGYEFHDWHEYSPPREKILADRAANRARQDAFRSRRSGNAVSNALVTRYDDVSDAVMSSKTKRKRLQIDEQSALDSVETKSDLEESAESSGSRNAVSNALLTPSHTHTHLTNTTPAKAAVNRRGTRISKSFTLDEKLIEYTKRVAPSVNIDRELEDFIDWWTSASGPNAVKLDWSATWRTWVRKSHDRALVNGWTVTRSSIKKTPGKLDKWLEARGISSEEYERRKTETGWLASMKDKKP
jgi:hypothetical protein